MSIEPGRRHYLAIFLLSMSLLMLEIATARVLSVALFSHYAFVAVSLAMFGIGLAGLVVYLLPQHFTAARLDPQLVAYTWRFALSAALSMVVFLRIRVVQELSLAGFLSLSLAYVVLAVPFFLGGVCIALLMTHCAVRIGRIYSADLIGASLGCIGVVAAMSLVSAPQVAVWVATAAAVTAVGLAWSIAPRRTAGPAAALLVALLVLVFGQSTDLLRMRYVKGRTDYYADYEGWNAFSRVTTFPSLYNAAQQVPLREEMQRYAGPFFPPSKNIDIDGTAWTPMMNFDGDFTRIDFLRFTVLYVAHHLRANASVLIIGTGGGRDILAAKTFQQPSVLGIELNPLMRYIVQEHDGEFSGRPYTLPGVEVIIDEARSRLSTLDRRFDVIQLSLIDTFSLNAAGGFVFSENHLYTVEGFREYLRHLTDSGILSISRYHQDAYPLEILRVASMVRAAWEAEGAVRPGDHVVVLSQRNTATVLAKRSPFTADELKRLQEVADASVMRVDYHPDRRDGASAELTTILTAPDWRAYLAAHPFRIDPPTDDRPFFFNFLRGRLAAENIPDDRADPFQFLRQWHEAVVLLYTLIAVVTLLALVFFFGPLLLVRQQPLRIAGAVAVPLLAYFACLGFGFMMIEVPLMQHFVLLLGYPVYALAVVLFALLLFSGLGSLASGRFAAHPAASLTRVLVAIVVIASLYVYVVPLLNSTLIGASIWVRIPVTVLLLAPIGTVLGMAYPLGITLLRGFGDELIPWAWALNGALSVVASVLAIFIGSRAGFTFAFLTGVATYGVALILIRLALFLAPAREVAEEFRHES
jgi:spermidine synthase